MGTILRLFACTWDITNGLNLCLLVLWAIVNVPGLVQTEHVLRLCVMNALIFAAALLGAASLLFSIVQMGN